MKEIRRDIYLNQLIEKQWNGQVKIITGLRRSGKSYLLFTLFLRHLIEHDVPQDHIITLALDDFRNRQYRQADALYSYELLIRGFAVDVGMVEVNVSDNGKPVRKQLEVDFVANKGSLRYYIQSAWDLPNREKIEQEQQSFMAIGDSFKKILIQKNDVLPWYNEQGVLIIGLLDFLLHPECIEK